MNRFYNRCEKCIFLGSTEDFDLYFCRNHEYCFKENFILKNSLGTYPMRISVFLEHVKKYIFYPSCYHSFMELAKLAVNKKLVNKCDLDSSRG